MLGTPQWCALADDDPRKLAALFDAAQHWALRVETSQEGQCQAAQAISAAADWSAIAQELRTLQDFHAEYSWAKRVIA
ncbi:hypothetical protein A5717_11625 [Mycolicibacterium porcinum]|nr:hypothetical protein A5717_11625 [Mycolicibacterium porcinum]